MNQTVYQLLNRVKIMPWLEVIKVDVGLYAIWVLHRIRSLCLCAAAAATTGCSFVYPACFFWRLFHVSTGPRSFGHCWCKIFLVGQMPLLSVTQPTLSEKIELYLCMRAIFFTTVVVLICCCLVLCSALPCTQLLPWTWLLKLKCSRVGWVTSISSQTGSHLHS